MLKVTSVQGKGQAVIVLGGHGKRQEENKTIFLQLVLKEASSNHPSTTPALAVHGHHWPDQFKIAFRIPYSSVKFML